MFYTYNLAVVQYHIIKLLSQSQSFLACTFLLRHVNVNVRVYVVGTTLLESTLLVSTSLGTPVAILVRVVDVATIVFLAWSYRFNHWSIVNSLSSKNGPTSVSYNLSAPPARSHMMLTTLIKLNMGNQGLKTQLIIRTAANMTQCLQRCWPISGSPPSGDSAAFIYLYVLQAGSSNMSVVSTADANTPNMVEQVNYKKLQK